MNIADLWLMFLFGLLGYWGVVGSRVLEVRLVGGRRSRPLSRNAVLAHTMVSVAAGAMAAAVGDHLGRRDLIVAVIVGAAAPQTLLTIAQRAAGYFRRDDDEPGSGGFGGGEPTPPPTPPPPMIRVDPTAPPATPPATGGAPTTPEPKSGKRKKGRGQPQRSEGRVGAGSG